MGRISMIGRIAKVKISPILSYFFKVSISCKTTYRNRLLIHLRIHRLHNFRFNSWLTSSTACFMFVTNNLKGSIMGNIMIWGKNSLNLSFEHCVY